MPISFLTLGLSTTTLKRRLYVLVMIDGWWGTVLIHVLELFGGTGSEPLSVKEKGALKSKEIQTTTDGCFRKTPTTALAELCELAVRQFPKYSCRSEGSVPDSSNGG